VLDFRGDYMVPPTSAASKNSPEGRIVGFGSSGSESDFPRIGPEERGRQTAGVLNNGPCFLAEEVNGTGISEILPEAGEHDFQDTFVYLSSCAIIQIDSLLHHVLEYHILYSGSGRLSEAVYPAFPGIAIGGNKKGVPWKIQVPSLRC
jgi:hypothetical protein